MTWSFSRKKKVGKFFIWMFVFVILIFGLKFQHDMEGLSDVSDPVYNSFVQEDGLFSFDYKNNYEVRENKGVYYLRELSTGDLAFQIYEKEGEVLHSELPEGILKNLELLPELGADFGSDKYEILTRAETLEWVLSLRYPEKDFSVFAGNCFDDVAVTDDYSGEICFAKDEGIVVGIGGSFYPDSSINLWGLLKILFVTFDEYDYDFDEDFLDPSMFELMTKYHSAYELIAKSYYEGLFQNVTGKDIWPNRNIYKMEAKDISANFFDWVEGKRIRNYLEDDDFELKEEVYLRDPNRDFYFERISADDFDLKDERDVKLLQNGDDLEVYVEGDGGVCEFLASFSGFEKREIEELVLSFDAERLQGDLFFDFEGDREDEYYRLLISEDEFSYFADEVWNEVLDENVLPNNVSWQPSSQFVPKLKLYMSADGFESILEERSLMTRYPVYAKLMYPDGSQETFSALIKTRGNANRGYVKSSYTIESFTQLDQAFSFEGDEFLEGVDEFKLRSLIADESMIKEKLIYDLFKKLGYIEPDLFDVLLEINDVPFGFYQLTEAVKDEFFARRGLETDYFYARNIASPYPANLSYFEDEEILLTHYEIDGGEGAEEKLLRFIYSVETNDLSLLSEIDIQNIFDAAYVIFAMDMDDSLMHNYYLYQEDGLWKWFFWDADESLYSKVDFSVDNFKAFTLNREDLFNQLIYFVFSNMSDEEFDYYYSDLVGRLPAHSVLVGYLDELLGRYADFYRYDNEVWNGKFLERRTVFFDTLEAIHSVKEMLVAGGGLEPPTPGL